MSVLTRTIADLLETSRSSPDRTARTRLHSGLYIAVRRKDDSSMLLQLGRDGVDPGLNELTTVCNHWPGGPAQVIRSSAVTVKSGRHFLLSTILIPQALPRPMTEAAQELGGKLTEEKDLADHG